MTLKKAIDKIINNPVEGVDSSLIILNHLEDEGLSLDGNGWLDDDPETANKLWSDEVVNAKTKVFAE